MTEHPEHVEHLIAACREYPGLDPRDVLEAIADPQWCDASRPNDWRNFVGCELVEIWESLPMDSRLVAYLMSSSLASRE